MKDMSIKKISFLWSYLLGDLIILIHKLLLCEYTFLIALNLTTMASQYAIIFYLKNIAFEVIVKDNLQSINTI